MFKKDSLITLTGGRAALYICPIGKCPYTGRNLHLVKVTPNFDGNGTDLADNGTREVPEEQITVVQRVLARSVHREQANDAFARLMKHMY